MGHQSGKQASGYLKLTEAHPDSAYWIHPDLRDEEIEELALFADDFERTDDLLRDMVKGSDHCWLIHGGPQDTALGLLGFGEWPSDDTAADRPESYIWLLPTKALFNRHLGSFIKQAKRDILPTLLKTTRSVGNHILQTNQAMLKMMRYLGFERVAVNQQSGLTFELMVLRSTE